MVIGVMGNFLGEVIAVGACSALGAEPLRAFPNSEDCLVLPSTLIVIKTHVAAGATGRLPPSTFALVLQRSLV